MVGKALGQDGGRQVVQLAFLKHIRRQRQSESAAQAETLLFRLLRGAGVRGLAAMPAHRPLAGGHLVRPLLDVSRIELEAYAHEHRLQWIEDPSNADPRFSRNYLR
ncbi:ATP-binding protein, partial [Klebsiella pneumoniae]|uniref:ATP-binding protein n=1 Tax=Klebsiella pneumoniae TaxID=573 RepID=UPI0027314585